jgi:hypothetical protein
MEYNPLNGLYVEHFDEREDYEVNQALLEGHLGHGAIVAAFPTRQHAEDALLALANAGFDDADLEVIRPEDVCRASLAADAAVAATPAEQPDAAASNAQAAPLVVSSVENAAARVAVTPGVRLIEAQRILREHGGEFG